MTATPQRTLAEYFPEVALPERPMQDWAIVQLKRSFITDKTRGGLYLSGEKSADEKNQEEWHETLAMVRAVGPVFQRDRITLEYWPEIRDKSMPATKVGDIVRIPEHLAGKFTVRTKNGEDVKCISVRDIQIMRAVDNPLEAIERVKAYIPLSERKV